MTPKLDDLLLLVEPERRDAARKFVETGEASEEMLNHLDTCPNCALFITVVFNYQAAAFANVCVQIRAETAKRKKPSLLANILYFLKNKARH